MRDTTLPCQTNIFVQRHTGTGTGTDTEVSCRKVILPRKGMFSIFQGWLQAANLPSSPSSSSSSPRRRCRAFAVSGSPVVRSNILPRSIDIRSEGLRYSHNMVSLLKALAAYACTRPTAVAPTAITTDLGAPPCLL